MHLHFVFPRWTRLLEAHPDLAGSLAGADVGTFRMAGLGLATAAGAVPAGHRITVTDENLGPVPEDLRPDCVCLSFFTPQATRAYAIADGFRARGVPVLAGGIHPTALPEEALAHCDAVVTGPVEGLWPTLLQGLAEGRLHGHYRGDRQAPFATPRRDLLQASDYIRADVVQTARGCRMGCAFCVLPTTAGSAEWRRPVVEVVADVAALPHHCYFIADENLLFGDAANRAYRTELCTALAALRPRRVAFTASYPRFLRGLAVEDLTLLAQAGLRQVYLVCGLMAPLAEELCDDRLIAAVVAMREAGIAVLSTFTLGHDDDREPVEPVIARFCQQTATNLAEFTIRTPFPGTADFAGLQRAGRLLTTDWSRYHGAEVVFRPLTEEPAELRERFRRLWRWFYDDLDRDQMVARYARGFGADILRGDRRG